MSFLIGLWRNPHAQTPCSSYTSDLVIQIVLRTPRGKRERERANTGDKEHRARNPLFQTILVVHAGFRVDLMLCSWRGILLPSIRIHWAHGSQDICKVSKQLDCSRCADWVGPEARSIVPSDLGLGFWHRTCVRVKLTYLYCRSLPGEPWYCLLCRCQLYI